jgi:LmbE family N-acetylglucosaminyl deacetylase
MVGAGVGENARSRKGAGVDHGPVGEPVRTQSAGQLIYALRALPIAASVLQLGAHPDDEDTGMLVTVSHGLGARAVYWSATRGEGGQNRRGPEMEEALGIVRTWESLQARQLDGGEVLYGPFYDYGFAKHGEDVLERWERDEVVREIVRAIRLVRPLVVISRWNGGSSDGHGHHQAIGMVADEAFDAAADPERFPDLGEAGLAPWRAMKLYHSVAGDWQPGEASHFGEVVDEYERAGHLRVDTGAFDPVAGLTFQEQAHMAVDRHRSQGMGFLPVPGPYYYYYRLVRSPVPSSGGESGFFDGVDPTLVGLAAYPGGGSPKLRARLEEIQRTAEQALAAFRPGDPRESGLLALQGAADLLELRSALDDESLAPDALAALDGCLERKAHEFERAAARCLGLRLECSVDRPRATPGRPVSVALRVWNGGGEVVEVAGVELDVPAGWAVEPGEVDDARPHGTTAFEALYSVAPPDDAAPSVPYWLRQPRTPYRYLWAESESLGAPFDPPLVSGTARVRVGERLLTMTAAATHTSGFMGGFRQVGLSVVPPVAVTPKRWLELVPASGLQTALDLMVSVECMEDDGTTASLRPEAPPGWEVEPAVVDLSFGEGGETHTLGFTVTIPAGAPPGSYQLSYAVETEGRSSGFDLEAVRLAADGATGPPDEANCGAEAFRIRPAAASVELIDAAFLDRLRTGYVEGTVKTVFEPLERFGIDVVRLSDDDLEYSDLSRFDVIVVDPNAYNTRDRLRENGARLLDFVAGGGTLLVQYQAYGYDAPGLAPYPFSYHQPHDRVTAPDAPVTLLEPEHPLLSLPNRLGPGDFDGWVHDRGLYFFGDWDPRYVPILSSADPGEEARTGGLLLAQYGRGTYAYVAYSLFRQIPAGVSGAVRLFANLMGLAEARIRTRVDTLQRLALMDAFGQDELEDLAHVLSEETLEAGRYLARQGEPSSAVYILTDGVLEEIDERGGRERVIGPVRAVDSVGELGALGHLPRVSSLRATTDVTVLVLSREELHLWLERHPELATRLMARVTARLVLSQDAGAHTAPEGPAVKPEAAEDQG